ncbi:hypothetical protein CROQUDRAFT_95663 [Cronartium quercuum f. sp. fusiforme G11]|uniref:Uncharacterized protein n=1 Tax=Cronartium quercuum f. sp. fusiforme G11 TaxID=708437 RepID=A0A9P6NC57_9BASI|nr:hypothetical protein CROQUDRAFT_95663 [Cronartium quercuum f. sp. fusiforme G11]
MNASTKDYPELRNVHSLDGVRNVYSLDGAQIRKSGSFERVSVPNLTPTGSPTTESGAKPGDNSWPSTPIYFEMVHSPSSPISSSMTPEAVVVVFEEDEIVEFELVESRPKYDLGLIAKHQEMEESDTLEGEQLPDFFNYTSQEREWIRGAGRAHIKLVEGVEAKRGRGEDTEEEDEEDYSDLWAYKI